MPPRKDMVDLLLVQRQPKQQPELIVLGIDSGKLLKVAKFWVGL